MSLLRPALALCLLAAAVPLPACGGGRSTSSSEATHAAGGASAGSSSAPADEHGASARVAESAKNMVVARLGARFDVWLARLAMDWGATPKQSWTAEKRADTRWLAHLTLTGPSGQRQAATWQIDFPLDRLPTNAELRASADANGDDVRPVDAGARALAKRPTAAAGTPRAEAVR